MAVARAQASGGADPAAAARIEAMLRDHRGTLLWIARRWSGSADEAEDALQRALEIYLRRLDTVDAATELAWLKVVVRHEAMALRRAAGSGVPIDALDVAERIAAPDVAVQERIESEERIARSREALAQLKPDERTALLLKAEGFSYREIGERQGWTYTKVNRAITEGRRRFLRTFAEIESGEECERFGPTLARARRGRRRVRRGDPLRPHLRHCATCRATVRELTCVAAAPPRAPSPAPGGVAPCGWLGDRVADGSGPRGVDVKALVHGAIHRVAGPDAATGMQLASSGGGRGTAVAALLSLCLGRQRGHVLPRDGRAARPTLACRAHGAPGRGAGEAAAAAGGPASPERDAHSRVARRPPGPFRGHGAQDTSTAPAPGERSERSEQRARERVSPRPHAAFALEGRNTGHSPGSVPERRALESPRATSSSSAPSSSAGSLPRRARLVATATERRRCLP
jgi:RNA polymerase sigma factor (sigma-70 family)